MRDSDWSREILLRSDWLLPRVALITTDKKKGPPMQLENATKGIQTVKPGDLN